MRTSQDHKLTVPAPRAFRPLEQKRRYRGASGGRGSGKSHWFCEEVVFDCLAEHTRAVCAREVLLSIKDSSKQLLEDKIRDFNLTGFEITEREIWYPPTESLIIFRGLQNHTAQSIKSLEGYNRLFVEEAQAISQRSLDLTIPTFRKNAVLDFAWNPVDPKDPVERLFADNDGDPDFAHIHVTYRDNPWFPDELRRDMERDRRRDPEKYLHVWLGRHQRMSEARVFRNFVIEEFETPPDARFYFGADWGFANDPTVLVRCFIEGDRLCIDQEAWAVGCEIDRTPALFATIPGSDKWPITADNARPETISYMRRHGFPRIKESIKGKRSVEDGIAFLKSFDIVVHLRCIHTAEELAAYAWKVDPKTNEVLPVLADKDNHVIDALRYGLEGTRRSNYTLAAVDT
jgi:phage terminase large subunit